MSEQEIKPFGYDWTNHKCIKCGTVGATAIRYYSNERDTCAASCSCGYFIQDAMRPADYREPKSPWEPKVGERVVVITEKAKARHLRPGAVSKIDNSDTVFDVLFDDVALRNAGRRDGLWWYFANELRPETREDRERRAREIVANAKPGDRFRVIENPVGLDGIHQKNDNVSPFAGSVVTLASKYADDAIYIREHEGQTIAAWNLVPLPAEPEAEPRLWVWREGDFRPLYKGEKYLCGKAVLTAGGYSSQPAYVVCPLPSDEVEALREFFDATNAYLFDPMNMRLDEKVAKARERVLAAREGAAK